MSSVEFYSWKNFDAHYRSPHDLKALHEYRKNALDRILKEYSTLDLEEAIEYRETMLSGRGAGIPARNLDQAEEMATALAMLGANILLREMDNACQCEYCNTVTVIKIGEDPPGFELHRCAKCSEIKRSCPQCGGQGWLRHYRTKSPVTDMYLCDDCYCLWVMDSNEMKLRTEWSFDEIWTNNTQLIRDFL
jgi:hypothetical protein